MPGRYRANAGGRANRAVRRLTTLGCSTVVMFGALSVLDSSMTNRHDGVMGDGIAAPPIDDPDRSDQDTASRGAPRDSGTAVGPTVVPTSDPNAKPSATAPVPADSGTGHRVVFDITAQQVWLVEDDGTVARTYIVSGSRYDQLSAGTYEVFSASRHAVSWHHTETMEYMVRFHRGENSNIGFHDIPVSRDSGDEVQTLSELGTPLSDGCIRQDVADAKALWDFAPVGTTVVVVRT